MTDRHADAAWLRELRGELGLLQREWAAQLGVHVSVLSRLESGAVALTTRLRARIADLTVGAPVDAQEARAMLIAPIPPLPVAEGTVLTGAGLRGVRDHYGLNGHAMAAILGIGAGFVSKVENGALPIPARWAERVNRAFGLTFAAPDATTTGRSTPRGPRMTAIRTALLAAVRHCEACGLVPEEMYGPGAHVAVLGLWRRKPTEGPWKDHTEALVVLCANCRWLMDNLPDPEARLAAAQSHRRAVVLTDAAVMTPG